MPDPTCPHEDCTETVTHWHNVPDGKVFICPRTKGRRCLLHAEPGFRCYAPRTQPAPLDAILAAADDAKRAHDRLCDLAETLLPESSPVKTADNPSVVLPTVDEAAEAVVQSTRVEGWSYRTTAQAILDLIADRLPVWVPVEPGTTIKAGTRYRIEYGNGRANEHVASFDRTVDDSAPVFIDPRTVPAEPDAALIADLRQYVTSATSDDELRDMIAAVRKADDARADQ